MQAQPGKRTRTRRRSVVIILSALALIVFLIFIQTPGNILQNLVSTPLTGHAAPDFTLKTWNSQNGTSNQEVQLASLRGKCVIINFWASWCDACKVEAPDFEATWQKYRTRNVVFIGIAFDDTTTDSLSFLRRYHISYINGPDTTGNIANTYQVTNTGVPETIFINPQGVVVNKQLGAIDAGTLERGIQAALA